MFNKAIQFIREVVLDSRVPRDLRSEGLDLLLEEAKLNLKVSNYRTVTTTGWTKLDIPLSIYNETQTAILDNRKMEAIKLLRAIPDDNGSYIRIGLKEAKDTVESPNCFQQPIR
jgi:ribosomal protein L7/L12